MANRASINDGDGDVPSEDQQPPTARFDADYLRSAIAEINAQKRVASEASGEAGKLTGEAVKNLGCEKNALTFAARLAAMEDSKRNGVVSNFIAFAIRMGWLNEPDIFLRQELIELINRTDNGPPGPPQ